MTWDPYIDAGMGTFDEYVEEYSEAAVNEFRSHGRGEPLLRALGNASVVDRVGIANFLLDHGANAAARGINEKVNALHVLFGAHDHDYDLEAPLLKRILEGDVDINLCSPRFGTPLHMLILMPASGEELEPFLELFFSRGGLDLTAPIRKDSPYTQRDFLEGVSPKAARRYEHARAYLEARVEVAE